MRVVQQGEAFAVQSQKAEGGQVMKCNIMLQELGGKYENQYVAVPAPIIRNPLQTFSISFISVKARPSIAP